MPGVYAAANRARRRNVGVMSREGVVVVVVAARLLVILALRFLVHKWHWLFLRASLSFIVHFKSSHFGRFELLL